METDTVDTQNQLQEDPALQDSLKPDSLPSAEAGVEGGESVPKSADELLDGLTVVFTDYPDCMDADTMDKWKQV